MPEWHLTPFEEVAHASGDGGEDDVVQSAAAATAHLLDDCHVRGRPIEAAMRADRLVQRRVGREVKTGAGRLGQRIQAGTHLVQHPPRLSQEARDERRWRPQALDRLVAQEHPSARHRPRNPGRRLLGTRLRLVVEQHREQVDSGNPVDHAVVRLADHGDPVALQSLDDPRLPQRFAPIQLLRHDACAQTLQLPLVSGVRQGRVTHVVVQVEAVVIHPHGVSFDGDVRQPFPVPRDAVQAGGDVRGDAIDVDSACRVGERFAFENRHRGDVHRRVLVCVLENEKRTVERRQALVAVVTHARTPAPLRPGAPHPLSSGSPARR